MATSAIDFRSVSTRDVWKVAVFSELVRVIKSGALDESVCPDMVRERVAALTSTHYREDLKMGEATGPFQPVKMSLDRIREAVLRGRNLRALREKLTEEKIERGIIVPEWYGSLVGIRETTSPEEERRLRSEAKDSASGGIVMNPRRISEKDAIEHLILRDLADLETDGTQTLDLPRSYWFGHLRSLGKEEWKKIRDQTEARFDELQERASTCYVELVAHNFPTLATDLAQERRDPAGRFYDIHIQGEQTHVITWECESGLPNAPWRSLAATKVSRSLDRMELQTADTTYSFRRREELLCYTGWPWSTSSAFMSMKADPLHCPLRGIIYEKLWRRLLVVLEDHAVRLGFDPKDVHSPSFGQP